MQRENLHRYLIVSTDGRAFSANSFISMARVIPDVDIDLGSRRTVLMFDGKVQYGRMVGPCTDKELIETLSKEAIEWLVNIRLWVLYERSALCT